MVKHYLKRIASAVLCIPFSFGLLMVLERHQDFATPGYWVADRVFPPRPGIDRWLVGWVGLSIDFGLCFAVVWIAYLMFLKLIHEVEK